MLLDAVIVLGATVVIGLGLAGAYLKGAAGPLLPLWPGLLHGALGVIGTGALLLALRGPPRGAASGAGSFGAIAAWFCGFAILFGAMILTGHVRRRATWPPAIIIHAMLGIAGFVMLWAFYAA
jgi:hypothetical protein